MSYLGDFKEDGDLFHKFTTRAFATGIPTTLSGSPVLSVYKDEGGAASEKTTAESYFDLDVDHDSIAGWNNVRMDLSGDAFFATGVDYAVVITTGTVDSVNVFGENLFTFSIENRSMGQPAGATLAADIAALKAETANILTDTAEIGTAGAGLSNINLPNQTMDIVGDITGDLSGSVGSVTALAADVITAASIATGGADEIAAAVWDEDATGHQTQGTFGQAIGDPVADATTIYRSVATDATGDNVAVDVVALKSETVLILADTGTTLQAELDGIQSDTENIQSRIPASLVGGRIDATIDATGFEAAAVDLIWDEDATAHQTGGTFGQAIGDPGANTETMYDAVVTDATGTNVAADIVAVKAETVLIVADTNELQTDNIPGSLTTLQSDTDDIQTRLPAALSSGNIKADVLAISTSTTAADTLEASALGIIVGTVNTGVEASTTTTFQSADITEATADHFNGRIVVFYDSADALYGQATDITDYALNGAEGKFTVTALTSAPADADKFVII